MWFHVSWCMCCGSGCCVIICYNLFTMSASVCGRDLWGRNMIVHLRQFEVSSASARRIHLHTLWAGRNALPAKLGEKWWNQQWSLQHCSSPSFYIHFLRKREWIPDMCLCSFKCIFLFNSSICHIFPAIANLPNLTSVNLALQVFLTQLLLKERGPTYLSNVDRGLIEQIAH